MLSSERIRPAQNPTGFGDVQLQPNMDNTGDVTVRMQEPLGGFFLANLHHGDRQMAFEGYLQRRI